MSSPGTKTLTATVCPATFQLQLGHIRKAPSRNPMYQSGWEKEVISTGL
jgi:hypothetical protein